MSDVSSTSPQPSRAVMPRALMVLIGLAATVIILAGMRQAADILTAVFLALVLTIAVHPLHTRLVRKLPSWLATVLVLIVVYLVLVGLAFTLYVSTAQFAGLLPEYADQFNQLVANITAGLERLGVSTEQLQNIRSALDLSTLTDILSGVVAAIFDVASNLVLILAMLLFLTIDGSVFPRLLGTAADAKPQLVKALIGFTTTTRRSLLVGTVFGLIVAVVDTIVLAFMGIPAPLLWGLLAFLTNYIPNIGFVIGLIPPAILALLIGGPGLMIAVIVIYSVINMVIQSVIQPKIVGDTVGLSLSLTFLSLVLWSWVLGPLGAVLAIPITLLVRAILIDADPNSTWLRPLVANKGPKPPKAESVPPDAENTAPEPPPSAT